MWSLHNIGEIISASDYDVETDPEVLRLYQAFFNREPDVGGAIYWIGIRDTNTALEIAGFFPSASAEFQNTYQDAAAPLPRQAWSEPKYYL